MMLLGAIAIPMGPWVWTAGVLLLAALVLLLWSYRRASRLGGTHRLAFCLKLLGILALALCLTEPLWNGRRAKSGANFLVIAADNSSGMNIRDRDTVPSRGEILRDTLKAGQKGWLAAMADNFQVRPYLFDSRLRRTADFSELAFDGKATAIGSTLRTLAERYRDRPLAGVLLMTDGCATDLGEQFYDLSGLPPVYPVVMGQGKPLSDVSVANVSVSQTSFEDAPVTIQADVEATGFAGRTVAVDLLEGAGKLVERQQWKVDRSDDKQAFRFRLRPDRTGVLFYRIHAAEVSAIASSIGSDAPPEATPANNERTVVVDRGKGPYRILYVGGRPNWDFKFVKRAMDEDEQVQLVGLLRVAKREPKYDWRGRTGETSNPLYRGFDTKDKDETGEYDQPVLVRLNTRDQAELRDGFPKTAEELFEYHAVIFDDIEAAFFTRDQMDLVRRFVTERGGGFLMLGGKESFQQGGFQRTPIGSILPVYLDPMPAETKPAETRLDLTREGWLQAWARLRDNEKDERERLSEMPEFRVLNRVRTVKPGAGVIATTDIGEEKKAPALVVQRLGNGRTATLAIGDIWRWGMRKPEMHEDMDKFWRQTLRWLISDVPGRISLQALQKPDETNQPVTLQVRVRDKAFEPMDNVSVTIEVREPVVAAAEPSPGTSALTQPPAAPITSQSTQLTATPVPTESGLFEAVYIPRVSGGYFAQATVADSKGIKLGDAQAGWTVDLEAREFQSVNANQPLLERIASQTGGRLVEIDELGSFARSLSHRNVPVTEVWVRPLWDLPGIQPAIFLFALACFVTEWALRRWRGIP